MNISCKIIEDLLPLYVDGVCSEESKRLVEEHIRTCPTCKKEFQNMVSEIETQQVPQCVDDENKLFSRITKKYNRSKKKMIALGAGVCGIAFIIAVIIYKSYYIVPSIEISADNFTLVDTKTLANDTVVIEFEVKEDYKNTDIRTEFSDGDYVIKALTPKAQVPREGGYVNSTYKIMSSLVSDGENLTFNGIDVKGVYLGESGSDKVIWESGMGEIPYGGKEMDKEIIGNEEYLNYLYSSQNNDKNGEPKS
ncbi:MAG: zf-HC2 domain-containing protein [Oscillospiraceae bacterium]